MAVLPDREFYTLGNVLLTQQTSVTVPAGYKPINSCTDSMAIQNIPAVVIKLYIHVPWLIISYTTESKS